MKYLALFVFLSLSLYLSSFSFADNIISFSNYMNNLNNLSVYNKKTSRITVLNKLILVNNQVCEYQLSGSMYILSPICILKKEYPDIIHKTLVDKIWPDLDGFSNIYNESVEKFSYESAMPIFEGYKTFFPKNNEQRYFLASLQEQGKKISIPVKYIYYEKSKELGYFVVRKDLSLLKKCTKQNYKVALNSFDNFVLASGENLNLNKHLSYLAGYCKGTGPQNLMFYGGVCGFASQLFRVSLINPDIDILKRFGHSVWLTAYYSDYVFGDDAAIYQNSKQFEIKNNSDQEIYFKVFDKGNYNYLVAITPKKPQEGINITKTQIGKLSAKVEKQIYDIESKEIQNNQIFESTYDYTSNAVR